MRFHLGMGSKAKRLFIPSPVKRQTLNGGSPDTGLDSRSKPAGSGFGFKSPDFGSKEETFFDSQALFDSDCEDDFYSVNGESTPSLPSTPNYQTITVDKAFLVDKFSDSKSETSPTGRKRLVDLLQETLQGEEATNNRNAADVSVEIIRKPDVYNVKTGYPPKSVCETLYLSGDSSVCSSEFTPNRDPKNKEKTRKAMSCCLPSLVRSFSFGERQKMSPARCGAELMVV